MINKREFPMYLLLSIVTCGVYAWIWIYQMITDINKISEKNDKPVENPTTVLLLIFLTCGIYRYIWLYTNGNKLKEIGAVRNVDIKEDGAAYLMFLILGVVTCGIFTYYVDYLFMNNLNKLAEDYNQSIPQ